VADNTIIVAFVRDLSHNDNSLEMLVPVLVLLVCFLQVVCGAKPIRVTCIGDSITSGHGGCNPSSYVDVLAEQLGSRYSVLNAGNSGHTMLKKGVLDSSMEPASYWDTATWVKALHSDPQIVTIMLGTNDAKFYNWEGVQQNTGDYYTLDYVDMINQLRQKTNVSEIFVMIPPPLRAPYPYDMNATIINTILPTLVPNIASVMGVKVIDLFTPMSAADYSCDGCHPTPDGNVIIANNIYTAIMNLNV
jgi:acyl-CoA thioesterase I